MARNKSEKVLTPTEELIAYALVCEECDYHATPENKLAPLNARGKLSVKAKDLLLQGKTSGLYRCQAEHIFATYGRC